MITTNGFTALTFSVYNAHRKKSDIFNNIQFPKFNKNQNSRNKRQEIKNRC